MSTKTLYINQANVYFHVYNRGVNGNKIFFDVENYRYFLTQMKIKLQALDLSILAYCLMPNHYHFLVFQKKPYAISEYIKSVCNTYVKAVNNWVQRKGHLFQGKYKIRIVDEQEYIIHLTRYIHLNPVRAKLAKVPEDWRWSSYRFYCGMETSSFINSKILREYFDSPLVYQAFVNEYIEEDNENIQKYLLGED